jgi:hypothetical protein
MLIYDIFSGRATGGGGVTRRAINALNKTSAPGPIGLTYFRLNRIFQRD